jgi:ATP-dependent protease HslVU (ClpYQ) peptidase subunit
MTCIVAWRNQKGVIMGADSCGGGGHRANAVKTPKVSVVGEYLIGYTSSFRMGQILHFAMTTQKHNEKNDLFWHLVNVLVPEMRSAMRQHGWLKTENNVEEGGSFLLAHGTRVFEVQSDFSVLEYEEEFIATGCGEDWAMGAMYALRHDKRLTVKEKLTIALEAASRYSSYVRPPFRFVQNY